MKYRKRHFRRRRRINARNRRPLSRQDRQRAMKDAKRLRSHWVKINIKRSQEWDRRYDEDAARRGCPAIGWSNRTLAWMGQR